FFSSRRRHTRCYRDWSSDVCSSDLIVGEDGMIGVHAAARQIVLERGVIGEQRLAGAYTEGFAREALDERRERLRAGRRDDDAPVRGLTEGNLVPPAEFADTFQMAEKIEHPRLGGGQDRQRRGPDARGIGTARGFAALSIDQFQSNRLYVRAQIEGFH